MTTAIFVLAALGVLNTLYLSYHAMTKTPVKCIAFPDEWCQKVQGSRYSKTFGIPNPYLGLLMYVAIFILTYLYQVGTLAFWPAAAVITFGFLFSLYFTGIQAFILKAYCTWCVLSAVEFLVLMILTTVMLTT